MVEIRELFFYSPQASDLELAALGEAAQAPWGNLVPWLEFVGY